MPGKTRIRDQRDFRWDAQQSMLPDGTRQAWIEGCRSSLSGAMRTIELDDKSDAKHTKSENPIYGPWRKLCTCRFVDIPLPGEALRLIGHEQSPPW